MCRLCAAPLNTSVLTYCASLFYSSISVAKIGSILAARGRLIYLVLLEQAGSLPWPVPDAQK